MNALYKIGLGSIFVVLIGTIGINFFDIDSLPVRAKELVEIQMGILSAIFLLFVVIGILLSLHIFNLYYKSNRKEKEEYKKMMFITISVLIVGAYYSFRKFHPKPEDE